MESAWQFAQLLFQLAQLLDLIQEPGIDMCQLVDFLKRHAAEDGVAQVPDAILVGCGQFGTDLGIGRWLAGTPAVF